MSTFPQSFPADPQFTPRLRFVLHGNRANADRIGLAANPKVRRGKS